MTPSPQGTVTKIEKPCGPTPEPAPLTSRICCLTLDSFFCLASQPPQLAAWVPRGTSAQGYRALTGPAASSRESPECQGYTPRRENL